MSKSNWAENATLDWLLGGANPTRPTTRYLSLHTADPTEDGSVGEISTSGTGYARQAITFGAASGGSAANTSTHDFTASGADWGEITHWAIWDDDGDPAGNCLYIGEATTPRTIDDGETATVAAGAIVCTES